MDLDLQQIYRVLDYSYNNKDRVPGKSVCLVIVPPTRIAQQFPEAGREGEDASPHHITVAYFGETPLEQESMLLNVINSVCKKTAPFPVKLAGIGKFSNPDANVYHAKIESEELHNFRNILKDKLSENGIEVDAKYPDYTPHMTIEYVHSGEERRFESVNPEGEWQVNSFWLWGFQEPHLIQLQ
jgi:2'-5' RNA ligase